jgi:hypothetical protein
MIRLRPGKTYYTPAGDFTALRIHHPFGNFKEKKNGGD